MGTDSVLNDLVDMTSLYRQAHILITGGTGSLGTTLVRTLHERYRPHKIVVYSRDECKQQAMARSLGPEIPELRLMLGDVRDHDRLCRVMAGCEFVIHAAALKHIDVCEYNPTEAVATNVQGSMNVVKACLDTGVSHAVLVSTDKAVNPINLYGATKLAAEKLFLAANAHNRTQFKLVRYGNVLASRGSVIETFLKLQAEGRKTLPITDTRMTRFWLTLPEAADLVLKTLVSPLVEVGIPRIPSMRMVDVAKAIAPEMEIQVVGMRPGEKLHECLVSPDDPIDGFEGGYYSDKNDLWLTAEQLREKIGLPPQPLTPYELRQRQKFLDDDNENADMNGYYDESDMP